MVEKIKPQINWFAKHKVVLLIIVAILILDIFVTGFMKVGYYVVKCGGAPVKTTHTNFWGGQTTYWLPGNYIPGGGFIMNICVPNRMQ